MTALATAPAIQLSPQLHAIRAAPGPPSGDRGLRLEIHGRELGPRWSGKLTVCDKRGHRLIAARGSDPGGDGFRLEWPGEGPIALTLEPCLTRRWPEGRHELRAAVETAGGVSAWEPFAVTLEHSGVRFFRDSELDDRGVALAPGEGWDRRLDGALGPCGAGRLNQVYYLFYVGASGDRADGGPRHRQLGFAISRDGVRFRKWLAPVVSQPSGFGAGVDGIFSAGLHLSSGRLEAYYSGLTAPRVPASGIRADLWRGTARDLRLWTQQRLVSGASARLQGPGRAFHPVAVLGRGRRRWIYGVTSSSGRDPWSSAGSDWRLALAELGGEVLVDLSEIENLGGEPVLGMSDPVLLSGGLYGFLLVRGAQAGPWTLEARTLRADRPRIFSEPESVVFARNSRFRHAALHLDRNLLGRSRWLIYLEEVSAAGSRFRVLTAEVFGR